MVKKGISEIQRADAEKTSSPRKNGMIGIRQ